MSNELEYRVIFFPAIDASNESIKLGFDSRYEADQNLNSMAAMLIFMSSNGMMNDFSNVAWVEQLVNGEWEEVEEDE